jgi:acylphosphatase
MKQKIEIIGPKVHGVGYRYFLMNQAMLQGVDGFAALNQVGKDGQQKVWVIVEGPTEPIRTFSTFAEIERPDDAEVSEVLIGDFEGFVPQMTDFALILTAGQIVKAIPIIQEIRSHTAETAENLR